MVRPRHLLLAIAAGTLLTACGADPPPAAPSSTPSTASPAPSEQSPAAPTTSQLAQDVRDAFEAAMATYPGADLDECTRDTPLTDEACGAAITAASEVAAETERLLRAQDPEHADLLYGAVFATNYEFQDSLRQLRDPIPCYGLSDAPQPPQELLAEAQSICAEAADIAKTIWRIFLDQVESEG